MKYLNDFKGFIEYSNYMNVHSKQKMKNINCI